MDKVENLTPMTTLKHTCGDAAQDLDDVTGFVAQKAMNAGTNRETKANVVRVTLTCETNDIRFSWTAAPTQDGGTAVGHWLSAGSSLVLTGHKVIVGFKFINKVNGSNAVLQITPEVSI